MANTLYPKAKEAFLSGSINMAADTIKVAFIDTGTYTYSASHQYYSSVSGVVGTPQALSSKTVTNGVFDAADVTFTALSGPSVEAIIIYKDTGNAATSPLIAYIDTASSGLPFTPSGGDQQIVWDNGPNKIFAL